MKEAADSGDNSLFRFDEQLLNYNHKTLCRVFTTSCCKTLLFVSCAHAECIPHEATPLIDSCVMAMTMPQCFLLCFSPALCLLSVVMFVWVWSPFSTRAPLSIHLSIISNQHTCLPSSHHRCLQELWTNCQPSLGRGSAHSYI